MQVHANSGCQPTKAYRIVTTLYMQPKFNKIHAFSINIVTKLNKLETAQVGAISKAQK